MQRIKNFSRTDRPSGFAGSPAGFGGATPDSAMDWLKAEGFVSVINLRVATEEGVDLEASRAAADAAGLEYVHLPFDVKNLDPQLYDKFLAAVPYPRATEGNEVMDAIVEIVSRAVDELLGRASGPLRMRLVMVPTVVTILAIRAGVRDAREGRPGFRIRDDRPSGAPEFALKGVK